MTRHRSHSAAFKRQVAEEFVAGETLHALSKRHDISRQLIRIWVGKFEAGALDEGRAGGRPDPGIRGQDRGARADGRSPDTRDRAAKGALKHAPRQRSATISVVSGPVPSPSKEGVS